MWRYYIRAVDGRNDEPPVLLNLTKMNKNERFSMSTDAGFFQSRVFPFMLGTQTEIAPPRCQKRFTASTIQRSTSHGAIFAPWGTFGPGPRGPQIGFKRWS